MPFRHKLAICWSQEKRGRLLGLHDAGRLHYAASQVGERTDATRDITAPRRACHRAMTIYMYGHTPATTHEIKQSGVTLFATPMRALLGYDDDSLTDGWPQHDHEDITMMTPHIELKFYRHYSRTQETSMNGDSPSAGEARRRLKVRHYF